MRFLFGLAAGLTVAASGVAVAAELSGGGLLFGWTVQVGGNDVCSDPHVYRMSHVIDCD